MSDFINPSDVDSGFGIESLVVYDRSVATPTTTTTLSTISVITPIFSSAGQDNKIVEITSAADMISKYGNDVFDFKAYGQQNLHVERALNNGGRVWACRLLPTDAKKSYFFYSLQMQEDVAIPVYKRDLYGQYELDIDGNKIQETVEVTPEVTPEEPNPVPVVTPVTISGVRLRWVKSEIPSALENLDIRDAAEQMGQTIGEEDGWTNVPIMFMSYFANGRSGNNIGFKILNDYGRDDTTSDGRRYQLSMYKKSSAGLTIMSSADALGFSFNPTATVSIYSAELEGLQAVYTNYDLSNNEQEVQLDYFVDNYSELMTRLTTYLTPDPVTTVNFDVSNLTSVVRIAQDVDIISGTDKNGIPYDNIIIDDSSLSSSSNILYLENGTDGSFDSESGLTQAEISTIKNELLIQFFNGLIDTANITNVLQCDAALLFDANYDIPVKKEMLNLQKHRQDIAVMFDCGFTKNLNEAIAVSKQISSLVPAYGSEKYTITPHCGTTVGRAVNYKVTATYEAVGGIIALYRTKPYTLYTGKPNDAGCVKSMLFDWVVDEGIPKGQNEKLAKENRLYYAIDMGRAVTTPATGNITNKNVYFYSNSNLYPEKTSKMAEWRNGILIGSLKRLCKTILVKYNYDPEGAENAIANATTEMNKSISIKYPSNITVAVNLYQTRNDTITNSCTCEIAVTFPNIFETFKCIITANRAAF